MAVCWDSYRASLRLRPSGKTLDYTGKTVLNHFGHLRPDDITRQHCDAYCDLRLQRDGRKTGTVHTELGLLRSALRHAEKSRLIEKAPYIWRPAKPTPKERYLTHDEIHRLIDSAATPHIRLAIVLLLGTAGRVGALLELRWDRVNFDQGTIDLRVSDSTTRKGRAIVPMNGMTRPALQKARGEALTDHVIEYAGQPVSSIRKGFHNTCERARLKEVTIHTLRHSAAVHMVAAGIPIEKVGQFLGHSNISITYSTYARYAPGHLADAAEVLNFNQIRKVP